MRETLAVAGSEATSPSYYAPVTRFLERHSAGEAIRVEVPLTRTHWETALLANNVSLARGWDKQLDERFDSVLLEEGLTASGLRGLAAPGGGQPTWRSPTRARTPPAKRRRS